MELLSFSVFDFLAYGFLLTVAGIAAYRFIRTKRPAGVASTRLRRSSSELDWEWYYGG